MPEKPQPDRFPEDDPPPHPAEPLQIDTPVIDMQDLEHHATAQTRVSNKGVRVEPTIDSLELHEFANEYAQALDDIENFEKSLSSQLPG